MTTAGITGTGNPPGRPSEAKGKDKDDSDILEEMRARFSSVSAADSHNRENYVQDTQFSSSADHWTDEVKKIRGTHRPTLTFNRLNGVVKQLIGDYRQNKIAIKVIPSAGQASEDSADILAGLLRNIEMESDADVAYVNALECSARGGFGYFRVMTEYEGDDVFYQNLKIKPIHNPLTVYFDPAAKLLTRSDARWCFITEMIAKEEFERLYPDADPNGFSVADANTDTTSLQDWGNDSEIRIAEYFTKENQEVRLIAFNNGAVVEIENDEELQALAQIGWVSVKERKSQRTRIRWRKATANEILEEQLYKIKYIPVVPVLGEEINLQGKVHLRSLIYYAKDAQRMYNYWKTAATESVALSAKAPWKLTANEIEGYEEQWQNVNIMPQPYIVFTPDPQHPQGPERIDPPNPPVGEMAMAGQAGTDIQYTTGIFDANLGQKSNETSGIAIGERQQQGATSTYIFIDNLKKAIEQCGRICIDWIPSVYDTERVIRIIGLEGDTSTETINQRKTNPILGITEILNDITIGKYDVVVETGPAFASRRREAVDGMMKFMTAQPQLGSLIADLAVKNMDWPGADEIAARLKRALPPQITTDPDSPEGQQMMQQAQQHQTQQQQIQQQMIGAKIQTEQGKQKADMAKSQASIIKSQAEVVKAEADTMQSVTQAQIHGSENVDHTRIQSLPAPIQQPPIINISTARTPEDTHRDEIAHQNAELLKGGIGALAEHLAASHFMNQEQIGKLHELMGHLVNNHASISKAMEQQNAIAMAPSEAIRDKAGRVIGKRKVMN